MRKVSVWKRVKIERENRQGKKREEENLTERKEGVCMKESLRMGEEVWEKD